MYGRLNYGVLPQKDNDTLIQDGRDERQSFEGSMSSFDYDEEFELLVKAYMRDMNYTTLNQAALNIVYSLINAGLVALPFTTQEAGFPLFIAVFIFMSVISSYTSIMVIAMANEQKVRTLEDLADCAFGRKGFLAVSICQLLFSFSLMCVTLDIWADIMGDVFRELDWGGWLLQSRNGEVFVGALLIFPLCLLKKSMSSLKWTSYVSVFAAVGALAAVVATYVTDKSVQDNIMTEKAMRETAEPKDQWWAVIFIAVLCYSCNQKVFTIYSSLRRRSTDRWQTATIRSGITITIVYILFGVTGYLSKYRKEIYLDNFNFFLSNSDEVKEVFDPARAVVAACLLITIPVDCLVCATTWRRFYSKYVGKYSYDAAGEYREVTCCDVVYAPVGSAKHHHSGEGQFLNDSEAVLTEEEQASLPNAERISLRDNLLPQPLLLPGQSGRDSSEEEEEEGDNDYDVLEVSAASVLVAETERSHGGGASKKDFSSSPSQRLRRKRFRRRSSRKNTASSSVKFDHSYSSSGAWSFFRSLMGTNNNTTTGRFSDSDKKTASNTTYADPRLSALRESFQDGDMFRDSFTNPHNPNNTNLMNTPLSPVPEGNQEIVRTSFQERNSFTNRNSFNNNNNNAVQKNPSLTGPAMNPSLTNTTNNTDGRASSLDHKMFGELLEEDRTLCPTRNEFVPTFLLWLAMVGVCSIAKHWMYIAAIFSVGTTLLLTFIFPAKMYFRLGLLSDYQAIPLMGEIVPNRAYMTVIQYLGMGLIIFDVLLMVCLVATNQNVIQNES